MFYNHRWFILLFNCWC